MNKATVQKVPAGEVREGDVLPADELRERRRVVQVYGTELTHLVGDDGSTTVLPPHRLISVERVVDELFPEAQA